MLLEAGVRSPLNSTATHSILIEMTNPTFQYLKLWANESYWRHKMPWNEYSPHQVLKQTVLTVPVGGEDKSIIYCNLRLVA